MKPVVIGTHGAEWLTESDLSAILKVSVKTIRNWRLLGRGPKFHKLNNYSVRYRFTDIEAWATAQPTGGERAGR